MDSGLGILPAIRTAKTRFLSPGGLGRETAIDRRAANIVPHIPIRPSIAAQEVLFICDDSESVLPVPVFWDTP